VAAELARRLSQAGVVSRDTLAHALLESSIQGVHLLQALATRDSSVVPALEAELSRIKCASVSGNLAIDYVQVLRLPIGLCKRLLAVPLQIDPMNSRWAVAAADPTDRHIAAEISYHLGGPVDVVRASLGAILNAVALTEERSELDNSIPLMDAYSGEERTPAFGTAAIMPLRRPSRWATGEFAKEPVRPTPRRGLSLPPVGNDDLQSEPPIPLVRPLPPRMTDEPARVHVSVTLRPKDPEFDPPRLDPSPIDYTAQEKIDEILSELEVMATAREVLQGFAAAVALVAERSAVFAVRSGQFHLEAVLPAHLQQQLSLGFDKSSVLNTACLAGYYLGPLARGTDSETLAQALEIGLDSEIYAVPVVVAERPAAVIVAGAIENTFAATQLIDKVALRGRAILEQLIQRRRQKR